MLALLLACFLPVETDYSLAAKMVAEMGEVSLTKMLTTVESGSGVPEGDLKECKAAAWYDASKPSTQLRVRRKEVLARLESARRAEARFQFVKRVLQEKTLLPITQIHPVDSKGETIGTVFHDRFRVTQVNGEDTAIVALWGSRLGADMWIEGTPTKGWIDGEGALLKEKINSKLTGGIVLVAGSKTYDTISGASRTIRRAHLIDLDRLNNELKPKKAAAFDLVIPTTPANITEWVCQELPGEVKELESRLEKMKAEDEEAAKADLARLDAEFRKWQSKDGKFSVVARLMMANKDRVILEKRDFDGKPTRVERAVLSEADNQFINALTKAEKDAAANSKK